MKYVITGSLGNISKPLAEKLIAAGHSVIIISSKADRKNDIETLGAKAAIGSIEDVEFLTKTFTGVDAVYTMIPPYYAMSDWQGYIGDAGMRYAEAIKAAGVGYVVNLSSVGAHMAEGCGPVSGLFRAEQALNKLTNVHIKHLRPGYFYTNLLANIGMVKGGGIIGGNFGVNTKIMMAHPHDIATAAAEELSALSFKGHSFRYVVSDERTTNDIAKVLGTDIGKPELPWIDFKDEDTHAGMVGAGLSEEMAKNYVEMGTAVRQGTMFSDYDRSKSGIPSSTIKLEDFAKEFAAVYSA